MTVVTVVLADAHGLFRDGLRALLTSDGQFDVVGSTDDGRVCAQLALRHRPGIVLLDTFLHGLDGIETARRIALRLPVTRLVVVTARLDPDAREAAFAAGVQGYVLKQSGFDVLRQAVIAALQGRRFADPLAERMPSSDAGVSSARMHAVEAPLSGREREIAQLFAEGHSTRQIAARLHISVKTVGTHREHIMRKLGVRSVAGMTRYAIREGLVSADD